jgi:hypothetical protein
MFDYTFMLVYPAVAGTGLGEVRHTVTIMAERPADAYRRLFATIDDMRRGGVGADCAVPDAYQWHGPRQLQHALIAD